MAELSDETITEIANAVSEKLSSSPDSAALLGSISDIWVLIALIIPGFIMIKILTWFIGHDVNFSQFLITIYSLMGSLGLVVVLSTIPMEGVDLSTIDQIRVHATNPNVIAMLFGLAVLFGVTAGIILKLTIFSKHFAGTAWDRFGKDHLGGYVRVYAKDATKNRVYHGYIKRISTGKDDKKDLTLGEPEVYSGKAWTKLGPELYLSEGSILQIEKVEAESID